MKLARYLVALLVLVVSCSDPLCGCPPRALPIAIVRGTVNLDTGTPASTAAITISVSELASPCVQDTMRFLGLADSQGRFRLFVYDYFAFGRVGGDTACVFLGARHPGDAPSTRDTILGPFKLNVRALQGNAPLDSLNVAFVLAP